MIKTVVSRGVIGLVFALAGMFFVQSAQAALISFNESERFAGEMITDQYRDTTGAVFSSFRKNGNPWNQSLMLFDTANPTGGDRDLGAPNRECPGGGPGRGEGGEPGEAGENCQALGLVMIISEDNDANDPDDECCGGMIRVDYDDPVSNLEVGILDIEENNGYIDVFSRTANDQLIVTRQNIAGLGDNSVQSLIFQLTSIEAVEIVLSGSGAITHLEFSVDDLNGSGNETSVPVPASVALLAAGIFVFTARKKK